MGNSGHKMLEKELKSRGNRQKRLKSIGKILRYPHADRGSLLFSLRRSSAPGSVGPLSYELSFMSRMRDPPLISKQGMTHKTMRTVCKSMLRCVLGVAVLIAQIFLHTQAAPAQRADRCDGRILQDRALVGIARRAIAAPGLAPAQKVVKFLRFKRAGARCAVHIFAEIKRDAQRKQIVRREHGLERYPAVAGFLARPCPACPTTGSSPPRPSRGHRKTARTKAAPAPAEKKTASVSYSPPIRAAAFDLHNPIIAQTGVLSSRSGRGV